MYLFYGLWHCVRGLTTRKWCFLPVPLTECPKMILSDLSWMDEHLQTLPHTEQYAWVAYFCGGIHTILNVVLFRNLIIFNVFFPSFFIRTGTWKILKSHHCILSKRLFFKELFEICRSMLKYVDIINFKMSDQIFMNLVWYLTTCMGIIASDLTSTTCILIFDHKILNIIALKSLRLLLKMSQQWIKAQCYMGHDILAQMSNCGFWVTWYWNTLCRCSSLYVGSPHLLLCVRHDPFA